MIGSNRFSAAFGNITSTPDPDGFRRFMRSAARDHRFALVFCETGTKLPVCTLNSRAIKEADDAAKMAARAAGDPRWDRRTHACGIAHATADPAEIDKYLLRRFKLREDGTHAPLPNVAIEVGKSRMLAIDVDTADELAGWAKTWNEHSPGQPWPDEGLTVLSPGVRDKGVWKHSDGGHVWIDLDMLPESVDLSLLSQGSGVIKHDDGWTAMYRDRYVLVPPSVRPEGPYRYNSSPVVPVITPRVDESGRTVTATSLDWLLRIVATDAANRVAMRMEAETRRAERLADPGTKPSDRSLIEWSQATPWHELLAAQGWVDTGLAHACGCPDWTMAPVEDHGSPRSATAHEDGCGASHYLNDEGHAPLHLWSDTRPPFLQGVGSTLTKLQFAASVARPETRHGQPLNSEDIVKGRRSIGMSDAGVDLRPLNAADVMVAPNPVTAAPLAPERVTSALATLVQETKDPAPAEAENRVVSPETTAPVPTLGTFGVPPEQPAPPVATEPVAPVTPTDSLADGYQTEKHFLDIGALLNLPAKTPLVEDALDLDSLCRVFGQSGHGKTFVLVDMAMSVITGRPWAGKAVPKWGKVVYLAAEDATGVGQRIAAWCRKHSLSLEDQINVVHRLRVITYPVQAGSTQWADMAEDVKGFEPNLVIVDTQAQTSVGYDENSNSDMMEYVKKLDQLRANTGACVVVVHHTTKNGKEARGASAVYGALDLEYRVTSEGTSGDGAQAILVENTKAKNRAKWPEPKRGALVPHDTSAVMTYDPTKIPDAAAARAREDVASGAQSSRETEVLAILAAHPTGGLTRNEWAETCDKDTRSAVTGKPRIPRTTARRIIEQIMKAGKVVTADGTLVGSEELEKLPRGARLFTIPAPEAPEDTRTE